MTTPCANCGASNPPNAEACHRCQLPLEVSESARRSATSSTETPKGSSSGNSAKGVFVLAALVVAAGSGAGAWAMLGGKRSESGSAAAPASAATAQSPTTSAGDTARAEPTGVAESIPPAAASTGPADLPTGELPRELIQASVRRGLMPIRSCFEEGARKNPELSGTVKVRFVIDPAGNVAEAKADGSDIADENVVACVVEAVKRIRFPRPRGGPVVVTYPFRFTAGEDDHAGHGH